MIGYLRFVPPAPTRPFDGTYPYPPGVDRHANFGDRAAGLGERAPVPVNPVPFSYAVLQPVDPAEADLPNPFRQVPS